MSAVQIRDNFQHLSFLRSYNKIRIFPSARKHLAPPAPLRSLCFLAHRSPCGSRVVAGFGQPVDGSRQRAPTRRTRSPCFARVRTHRVDRPSSCIAAQLQEVMAGCRRHEERRAPLGSNKRAKCRARLLLPAPLASLAQSRLLPLPLRFRMQKPRLRSLGGPAAFPARGRRLRLRSAITPSPPLRGRPAPSRRLRLASLACNRRALAGRVAAALNMPSPAGLDGERTPSQAQDAPAQAG